jgi:hypothetical protein
VIHSNKGRIHLRRPTCDILTFRLRRSGGPYIPVCRLSAANIFNLFLKEVFLRSVILFQSDFSFMRKDLRFPLRSFEFGRCGKSDKRIVAHQRSVLVHHVQVTPQNINRR